MYDYDQQIQEYHRIKVNLPNTIRKKLRDHRKANQDRLIANTPEGITVNTQSFVKQGSYAMKTTIQEKNNAYDIDDGVVFRMDELVNADQSEMTPDQVKQMVKEAVTDGKFSKKPKVMSNCVRVFYAEGHHVDIPAYRRYEDILDDKIQEIASVGEWRQSDPQRINVWFFDLVEQLNQEKEGAGGQLRRMIRMLKRFARSRGDGWDMPSGIKLTMLAAESFHEYDRDDEAFYHLLDSLQTRLASDLVVENLSDTSFAPENLTKTSADANMVELREKIAEALQHLAVLHDISCTREQAREAWDWVFQSDGFLEAYDKDAKHAVTLFEKETLIAAGLASTDSAGCISVAGVPNKPHKWYGQIEDTKQ